MLERILPYIDEVIPVEQTGFRYSIGCEEQVLALTTLIENNLQNLKTNVAFIDLSVANNCSGDMVYCIQLVRLLNAEN